MRVADDLVSDVTKDPLHRLTDDCRTHVSDMQRLGNIRSAVVDDHRARVLRRLHAEMLFAAHPQNIVCEKFCPDVDIDKSRCNRLARLEHLLLSDCGRHLVRYCDRRLVILLRGSHGTVALILAQVRAVGYRCRAETLLVSACFKRIAQQLVQKCYDLLHAVTYLFSEQIAPPLTYTIILPHCPCDVNPRRKTVNFFFYFGSNRDILSWAQKTI